MTGKPSIYVFFIRREWLVQNTFLLYGHVYLSNHLHRLIHNLGKNTGKLCQSLNCPFINTSDKNIWILYKTGFEHWFSATTYLSTQCQRQSLISSSTCTGCLKFVHAMSWILLNFLVKLLKKEWLETVVIASLYFFSVNKANRWLNRKITHFGQIYRIWQHWDSPKSSVFSIYRFLSLPMQGVKQKQKSSTWFFNGKKLSENSLTRKVQRILFEWRNCFELLIPILPPIQDPKQKTKSRL